MNWFYAGYVLSGSYLVTGGSGSLGYALAAKLLSSGHGVRILSRNEERQRSLEVKLRRAGIDTSNLDMVLGDCSNRRDVGRSLESIDFVVHAAAMKDLIVCEDQPSVAIRNNVWATEVLLDEMRHSRVKAAVAVSTDKAAAPSSMYGASKLLMEGLVREESDRLDARVSTARFGNMIDSAGSLVSEWINGVSDDFQITDPKVSRFFFTTADAADFVFKCLEMGSDGDVLVPRMKAVEVLRILGQIEPDRTYPVRGLFPGEKLHEQLLSEEELRTSIEYDWGFRLTAEVATGETSSLSVFSNTCDQFSDDDLRQLLSECRGAPTLTRG